MSEIAIRVEGLGKQYRLGTKRQKYTMLRDTLASTASWPIRTAKRLVGRAGKQDPRFDSFWALQDVTFHVNRGEVVGVIGRNGAGKSTLLKVLSRITEPSAGFAEIHGRVGSLLEVGTGFHPELSGRENIYLNGAILGMRRAEIDRKFDEIVEFAEVERFIETPVKHYSSGMYLRLAFGVAAHLEPDILVVDEVLAVGDAQFQKKCLGKMGDVAKAGRTVLFVSHNMGAVAALCTNTLVLDGGKVVYQDVPDRAIAHYISRQTGAGDASIRGRTDREGNQHLRFTDARIINQFGLQVDTVSAGEDITIELDYDVVTDAIRYAQFQINFMDSLGQILFTCFTKTVDQAFPAVRPGSAVRCFIPKFPLAPGAYTASVTCYEHKPVADRVMGALNFTVIDGPFFGNGRSAPPDCGPFMVFHRWELREETRSAGQV